MIECIWNCIRLEMRVNIRRNRVHAIQLRITTEWWLPSVLFSDATTGCKITPPTSLGVISMAFGLKAEGWNFSDSLIYPAHDWLIQVSYTL